MLECIAEILALFDDFLFWRRKKKRRKFEKENNLPKKIMIKPRTFIIIVLVLGLITLKVITRVIK